MVDDAYWHVLPGLLDRKPQVAVVGDDQWLALLGGPQDRKWPLTCGAKGTRTPGLLDANHIFRVFLRRWTCPDGPSSCGDCRQLSVDVAWSLAPLALCLALP